MDLTGNSTNTEENELTPKLPASNRVPWLGELLLSNGLITVKQLEEALQKQRDFATQQHWKPVGEILIEMNLINHYQLEDALRHQAEKRSAANRTENKPD